MKRTILLICLALCSACSQYPAQKTPWPVGTTNLYFHKVTDPAVQEPLTVDAVYLDATDIYDGHEHYFYAVHGVNGGLATHVIDYQLTDKR